MTEKRFINDVSEILDTWFGYMGEDEPTEREIKEKDYLLIGVARSQRDAENICEKLNEQNEELIEYCNFSLHDLLDKKNKEIEQLKQKLQIYKSDGMETLNDLQKARDNNKKALKSIEKITEENNKTKYEKQLDFIVNLLFTIHCNTDVHYNELLAKELATAEHLGFDIEESKSWDYDESSYEFWKKELQE